MGLEKQDEVGPHGTAKFIWDEHNVLLETDGNDSTQAAYTLEPMMYGNLLS